MQDKWKTGLEKHVILELQNQDLKNNYTIFHAENISYLDNQIMEKNQNSRERNKFLKLFHWSWWGGAKQIAGGEK